MKKRICIKDSEEFVLSLRKKWPYAVTITIVICTLCILYRNLNMRMPINYSGGDEMGVFYLIKSIKESGTHFINALAGGVRLCLFGQPFFLYSKNNQFIF